MSKVVIRASRTYEVQIEDRLPADTGERVRAAVPEARRAAILADDAIAVLEDVDVGEYYDYDRN